VTRRTATQPYQDATAREAPPPSRPEPSPSTAPPHPWTSAVRLLRLADLEVRIPRLEILALERLADRDGKSVDAVLARELLNVVSAHSEYLATAIPAFTAALRWPSRSSESCEAYIPSRAQRVDGPLEVSLFQYVTGMRVCLRTRSALLDSH
jgi:hypothetical protein